MGIPIKFKPMGNSKKKTFNYASDSTVLEIEITDEYKELSFCWCVADSIDWGDGTKNNQTSHIYTQNGTYVVKIKQNRALRCNDLDWDNYTIIKVLHLSNIFTDATFMFFKCQNLTEIHCTNWDTSSITNFRHFANRCSNLKILDTSNWDTSNSTNFEFFATSCTLLTNLNVTNWNVSRVRGFSYFAYGCSNLTKLDLNTWEITTNAIDNIANGCTSITEAYAIDQTTCDKLNATAKPDTWQFIVKP